MVDDPAAVVAQKLVLRLHVACEGLSLRDVERSTGIDHATVARVLAGETWPDLETIARLEHGLGVALWPDPTKRSARTRRQEEPT
jgi:transcriptional regulator with XRE-family HTH domain